MTTKLFTFTLIVVLIIAGLFVLVSPAFFEHERSMERTLGVGAGAILFGLAIVSSYGGTHIDFTQNWI